MSAVLGIIAFLTVLSLSLIVTRIAAIALTYTGLSCQAASFQARSAFTGTGFTTREAEKVVDHPVRRRIIMLLMVVRSAGMVIIVISLIFSFADRGDVSRLTRLGWLVGGAPCSGCWPPAASWTAGSTAPSTTACGAGPIAVPATAPACSMFKAPTG
jgi:hypothetical protein